MSRQRKIRFIEPQGRPDRPLNAFITRWPVLGPITLATILHERGYDVSIYNENISGPLDENPKAYQDVCSADVVGISIMTPVAYRGYTLADRIRSDAPAVTIAFGGVHATFRSEEALLHADIVVRGEGETVIESIAAGEITSGIVEAKPLEDLDELPTLNHFLMQDFDRFVRKSHKRELYEFPLITSRGCPYGCTYCSVTGMFGRRVRRQSVEKVLKDIRHYVDQGFRNLFFFDDNFTSDRAWTKQLLARLRSMNVMFSAQARVDFHWIDRVRGKRDDELLKSLRRGGCIALLMGYETIDDETASEWRKGYQGNLPLEARLAEDTKILHDNGIWTYAMFVLGPRHTARTAMRVLNFAKRCDVESFQMAILTPFPGTPLFEQMRPHLVLDDFPADWDYYDGTHCVYDHARMGAEEFQNTVIDVHRRFYRFGGWSPRSIRAIARRPVAAVDKLIDMGTRVIRNRDLFGRWSRESDEFVRMLKARTKV